MKAQNTIVWILLAGIAAAPTAFANAKAKDQDAKSKADQNAAPPAGAPPSEKLDVSDLENKYWAPKDTDFSVVQNRTFTKEHKWFISGQFGPDISGSSYTIGNWVGVTGNYFWSERYGLQATYLSAGMHSTASVGDLANQGGFADYGIPQDQYQIGFNWVPFYSKMSFLGQKILYFDMAITPTIGMMDYTQVGHDVSNQNQSAFTYGFDVTQYYFFTSHFAFRVDLKNEWWSEKVMKAAAGGSGIPAGTQFKTDSDREMIFLLGFTYYFGL